MDCPHPPSHNAILPAGISSFPDRYWDKKLRQDKHASNSENPCHCSLQQDTLYGDMDMAEKLEWIDENYLSRFDKLEIDSALKQQEEHL